MALYGAAFLTGCNNLYYFLNARLVCILSVRKARIFLTCIRCSYRAVLKPLYVTLYTRGAFVVYTRDMKEKWTLLSTDQSVQQQLVSITTASLSWPEFLP